MTTSKNSCPVLWVRELDTDTERIEIICLFIYYNNKMGITVLGVKSGGCYTSKKTKGLRSNLQLDLIKLGL